MLMASEFAPRISCENGQSIYQDNRVFGVVSIDGPRLLIKSWTCLHSDRALSVQALTWLRGKGFTVISVVDIAISQAGESHEVMRFWLEMQRLDLVDHLYDKDGVLFGAVDEFTFSKMLSAAAKMQATAPTASSNVPRISTRADVAKRRLSTYSLLDAFGKGQLRTQKDPLEDSDLLYSLLDTDPARYSASCQSIFSLTREHSPRVALNLLKHARGVNLLSFDCQKGSVLTYLYNAHTGQVMSANGVECFRKVTRGRKVKIIQDQGPQAHAPWQYAEDIDRFGLVAELIREGQSSQQFVLH